MLPAIISISLVQALTHTVLVHVPAHTRTHALILSLACAHHTLADDGPACGGCGTVMIPGQKFCTQCGKPCGLPKCTVGVSRLQHVQPLEARHTGAAYRYEIVECKKCDHSEPVTRSEMRLFAGDPERNASLCVRLYALWSLNPKPTIPNKQGCSGDLVAGVKFCTKCGTKVSVRF
jgi:hypothetical protein